MFISTAFAQGATTAATGTTTGGLIMSMLPLLIIVAIFYLLIFLPQKKQHQERLAMLKGLRRGDRVITSGGILGTIHRLPSDDEAILEIADGVHIHVMRSYLSNIRIKPSADSNEATDTIADSTKE